MKKVMSNFRYLILAVVVSGLWVLGGCSSNSDPAPTKNIVDLISSTDFKESATVTDDKALDSLVKYVSTYPDLVTLLSGTTQYTLFAPSNKAFKNLLATPGFPSNITLINPDIIKDVLSYHVVADQKLQSALTSGLTLPTLYTDPLSSTVQNIVINADGTLKTGSTNDKIAITVADKKATNGVVHVTASVLIPPSVGATLTPILGTMAGTILLGKDFSYLAALISKADAGVTEGADLNSKKISTLLAIPANTPNFPGATFFAPPNAVITAAAGAAGVPAFLASLSQAQARGLLLNHYVLGKWVTTGADGTTTFPIESGKSATAMSTGKLYFLSGLTPSANNPYGIIVTTDLNTTSKYAPIVIKDLSVNNGKIQVIAGILQ
ncbi:MAG: fasciclin domain-containing protein [Cyclobacteriaceae bacterium]|nr:fasciclin domain-containing protein [Cyclobacteriaceae bacterium]